MKLKHRVLNLDQKRIERFWTYVDKRDGDECWPWKGFKNRQGYGTFWIGGKDTLKSHRISWTIVNGAIPDGHFVCHKCDNTSCVRPDHLFTGTRQDNMNDMMIKKRSRHFKNNPYYGVQWTDRDTEGEEVSGRWRSVIVTSDDKMRHLGYHTSVLEAARNYDRIAYICYGERERLNFPEQYVLDERMINERKRKSTI